jgi:hypothetical protein
MPVSIFKEAWLARETRRWMKHDAFRWWRPDHARFLRWQERKANFNPDQPRIPMGEEGGGQWTSAGVGAAEETQDDESQSNELDEVGAGRRGGHHFVPRAIFRNLPLSPETMSVFDNATTGPLQAEVHRWSREHLEYSRALEVELNRFMQANGIRPESMTPEQARIFVDSVKRSTNPAIRDFNLNIYRRELRYLLRFGPRRLD